jgi:hypothetical protein
MLRLFYRKLMEINLAIAKGWNQDRVKGAIAPLAASKCSSEYS